MKKNTLTIILLLTVFLATAQTKTKSYPSNTVQKPATLQPVEKNIPVPKLPDLKITDLKVTATPSVSNGVETYMIRTTYTIQNVGYAAVLTDYVSIQGYSSDESWVSQGKKELTGYYMPAGGQILSKFHGKGEKLEAGASITQSFDSYNNQLHKDPKPIFILQITTFGNVQEISTTNNLEFVPITL